MVISLWFISPSNSRIFCKDNQNVLAEGDETKYEKEGAHVMIYVSRNSLKFTNFRTKEKDLYHKYDDIKNPSLYETIQKKDESK